MVKVGQKTSTSSYDINNSWGCNVQHDRYNLYVIKIYNDVCYTKIVKRVNPEFSSQGKILFSFYLIFYLYEMTDGH